MDNLLKTLGWRFLRGFVVGSLATAGTLTVFSGNSLGELKTWAFISGLALFVGGINGGILALGKYLREKGFKDLPF